MTGAFEPSRLVEAGIADRGGSGAYGSNEQASPSHPLRHRILLCYLKSAGLKLAGTLRSFHVRRRFDSAPALPALPERRYISLPAVSWLALDAFALSGVQPQVRAGAGLFCGGHVCELRARHSALP